jgi:hypothetical protein
MRFDLGSVFIFRSAMFTDTEVAIGIESAEDKKKLNSVFGRNLCGTYETNRFSKSG